jgi:CheY-like chemotaxis protein
MEKVLIIDDDRSSRLLLKHVLERLGYVVIQSGNGRHGWETLWENLDISFVITDMMMPDMDGRELIHLIRQDEEQKELPVIILSGCFGPEDVKPILEISPEKTFFLNKPLDKESLMKHIEKIQSQKLISSHPVN